MQNDIVRQNEEIISVGELNKSAKYLLENNFQNISVIGEISNLARPSSGHIYFTLKDEDGAIRCAMFKNQNLKLNFSPDNGDKCVLKGQVSLYAPRGDYQLIVKSIKPAGEGNLMQQFEALKKKLDSEGLFNRDKKVDIPESPKHIGIITSLSTAAFQDIISTVNRRAPSTKILVSEATVQGDNAHVSILKAMERIIDFNKKNESNPVDLVVFARGGGSIEDLWCFNNEELAREIFNFPIPTISGVGHEIDFTICDFVSDIRVPTPTAAAELITEFNFQLQDRFSETELNLERNILQKIENLKLHIDNKKAKLKNPLTKLREISQSIDNVDLRLHQNQKLIIANYKNTINLLSKGINSFSPEKKLIDLNKQVVVFNDVLKKIISTKFKLFNNQLIELNKNLDILNPLSILDRGYAIVTNDSGKAIKSSKEVSRGELLKARLSKGTLEVDVKNKNE
ncbi:MAG: exodeoxyribonuclease VII large subunit [Gammaproteobacteria bacterium]